MTLLTWHPRDPLKTWRLFQTFRHRATDTTETKRDSTSVTTTATIPYIKGTSEAIARILQPYNIRVAHKPITTLRHLLTNVKDKDEPNNRQGAIYKIECSDCQASYIGETGRNLNTRLTEHKRATRNGDVNNHISEHHRQTNHRIDWDSAKCLTYSTNYFQRLTLESWFTNLEQTPLNRCQQLPAPYKQLINDVNKLTNRPTNNRQIETDQWLLTNSTRVFQPITSWPNRPITFNRPDFRTSSTDNYSSLDSEDDFHTGCQNVSHQQQFFSELHSPGQSHYMNYWYSWVQTIYFT